MSQQALAQLVGKPMDFEGNIGEWIRGRRKALDLTLAEFGDQVGCTAEYIRKIEQGTRRPSKAVAPLLADALRLPLDEREKFIAAVRSLPSTDEVTAAAISAPPPAEKQTLKPVKLIGRSHELTQIKQLLADPECRLLTIFGPGGIGKTELALTAAKAQAANFRNGVVTVMLAAVQSTAIFPSALTDALNLPLYGDNDPFTEAINFLREKQLLLILDNFEHLFDAADAITQMLAAAPDVKILVTSRERLRLSEEWVLDLQGLAYPADDQPVAESYGAVELFCRYARRLVPGFSLGENAAAVGTICRQVRGMPLAIEMATSWLRYQSCQEIAEQMNRDRMALTSTNRDVPSRHRSMKAVFDQSWRLLSEAEQRAMMMLSVFAGQFTTEAALEVAKAPYETLLALADKTLLNRTESARFGMHPLIRQYAADHLAGANNSGATHQAHSRYYAGLVNAREADLKGQRRLAAIGEIKAEWDNVRTACGWVLDQRDFELMALLVEGLYRFGLEYRLVETQALWRQALDVFAPQSSEEAHLVWGRLLAQTVLLFELRGSGADPASEIAQKRVEMSLAIARRQGDPREIGYSLFAQGLLLYLCTDFNGALCRFEDSVSCYRAVNDGFNLCLVYAWVALSCLNLGQIENGLAWSQQYLNQTRLIENRSEEGWALQRFGFASFMLGHMREAGTYFHASKDIMVAFGNFFGLTVCETLLGLIAFYGGDTQQAMAFITSSMQLARDTGYVQYRDIALSLLGTIECLEAHYDRGKATLDRAFGSMAAWEIWGILMVRHGLALYCCGSGDDHSARQHLEALRDLPLARYHLPGLTSSLPIQAVLLAHQGQSERAVELLGLVSRYPSEIIGWMVKWPLLTQLRAELELKLGAKRYLAVWEHGKTLDLEATVAELFDKLEGTQPQAGPASGSADV